MKIGFINFISQAITIQYYISRVFLFDTIDMLCTVCTNHPSPIEFCKLKKKHLNMVIHINLRVFYFD